jgi:hypothetical protein
LKSDFWGVTFHKKIPGCSLSAFLIIPHFSACRSESIGIFIVKIGRTDEKILLGVFFDKNCPLAPLEWNFENFDVFVLFPFEVNQSVN